jgi:type VI secretion system FHA domain protein
LRAARPSRGSEFALPIQAAAPLRDTRRRIDARAFRRPGGCDRLQPEADFHVTLSLELSASTPAKPGVATRHVFTEDGGTIGRDGKAGWVLPDREVSGSHAQITFRNGVFYIEDTNSTNGIAMNAAENRLAPSRRYPLTSGDRLFIRPYVITVTIDDEPLARPVRSSPDVARDPFFATDPFAQDYVFGNSPFSVGPEAGAHELDPDHLIPGPPKPRKRADVPAASSGSLLEGYYRPPDPIAEPSPPAQRSHDAVIPPDYNPLESDSAISIPVPVKPVAAPPPPPPVVPRPTPPPPPPRHAAEPIPIPAPPAAEPTPIPAPRAAGAPPAPRLEPTAQIDVGAVLEKMGLDGSVAGTELERHFGEILRVVVAGVMEVLRARQEIKDEFRMHLTQFRPAENNPLKFSANVDDALHNLLVKRNAAYLAPVEAFAEAFEDLRHHQLAMLQGMRAAFDAMLEQFDPDYLQKEFDRQLKSGSLLSVPAKLRYWDMYRERCRDMVRDKEAAFRKLFGEEFAEAYEVQLRRLKAAGRPAGARGAADRPE